MIFAYLDSHPGEKASILPSVTMLMQKVQSFGYTLIGRSSESITIKASLAKNFDELSYLLENNDDCKDPAIAKAIEDGRSQLKKVSFDNISSQQYGFYSMAVQIKAEIEKKCGKK